MNAPSPGHETSPARNTAPILGILALAGLLRLPFVLEPGITGDEANYVMIARCTPAEIATGKALDPSNPPLYMLLLHGLLRWAPEASWPWKLMSVVMNLAMIALAILLVRDWLGTGAARLTGILAAISPWQIYMATEVRGYAMVALLGVFAMLAAQRFDRTGRALWAALWALACAAGFWTHYSMIAVAGLTGIWGLARVRHRRRAVAAWCVSGLVSVVLMGLWLPIMRSQPINIGGQPSHFWHLFGLPVVEFLGTTYLRPGVRTAWLGIGTLAALAVFGPALVIGLGKLWKRDRGLFAVLVGMPVVGVAIPLLRSLAIGSLSFSTRYVFVTHICVLATLALGLSVMTRRHRAIGLGGIVVLCGVSLAEFRWSYVGRSANQAIFTRASACAGENEAIVTPDPITAMRLRYYTNEGGRHCFIWSAKYDACARLPAGATWTDAVQIESRPGRFFTAAAMHDLHQFDAIWYWPPGDDATLPQGLAPAYRADRVVTLAPGGQFGAEQKVILIRCTRAPG